MEKESVIFSSGRKFKTEDITVFLPVCQTVLFEAINTFCFGD